MSSRNLRSKSAVKLRNRDIFPKDTPGVTTATRTSRSRIRVENKDRVRNKSQTTDDTERKTSRSKNKKPEEPVAVTRSRSVKKPESNDKPATKRATRSKKIPEKENEKTLKVKPPVTAKTLVKKSENVTVPAPKLRTRSKSTVNSKKEVEKLPESVEPTTATEKSPAKEPVQLRSTRSKRIKTPDKKLNKRTLKENPKSLQPQKKVESQEVPDCVELKNCSIVITAIDLDAYDFDNEIIMPTEKMPEKRATRSKPALKEVAEKPTKPKVKRGIVKPSTSKPNVELEKSNKENELVDPPSTAPEFNQKKRLLSPEEEAPRKRFRALSPTQNLFENEPPARKNLTLRKLIEIDDDLDDVDIYNFRMSQPAVLMKKKGARKPRAPKAPKNKKATKPGSKLENMMQQRALNVAGSSCIVKQNPQLFQKEKEMIQQKLISGKRVIDSINLDRPMLKGVRRTVAQRPAAMDVTKTRTPPLQPQQRRLNLSAKSPANVTLDNLPLIKPPAVQNLVAQNRASLVFSPKIVSSPKVVGSPFRVNDEVKFPRTFYFGLDKNFLPSYSSDPIEKDRSNSRDNSNEDQENQENVENEENVENQEESVENEENIEQLPNNRVESLKEPSIQNNSDAENIAPTTRRPMKTKKLLANPNRTPLKALAVSQVVGQSTLASSMQSPLAIYSYTGKPAEWEASKEGEIEIQGNETVCGPEAAGGDHPATPAKRMSTTNFGFDDLVNDSLKQDGKYNILTKSAMKDKLKDLRQYLPSRRKIPRRASIASPALPVDRLFRSPNKVEKDIRQMFSSTPNVSEVKRLRRRFENEEEQSVVTDADTIAEETTIDGTQDENASEVEQTVDDRTVDSHLFDDPEDMEVSVDPSKTFRNYSRKRKMAFLDDTLEDLEEQDDEDDYHEQKEHHKKKKKKTNVETKEFKHFVEEMNSMFEEVDNYPLVIE